MSKVSPGSIWYWSLENLMYSTCGKMMKLIKFVPRPGTEESVCKTWKKNPLIWTYLVAAICQHIRERKNIQRLCSTWGEGLWGWCWRWKDTEFWRLNYQDFSRGLWKDRWRTWQRLIVDNREGLGQNWEKRKQTRGGRFHRNGKFDLCFRDLT